MYSRGNPKVKKSRRGEVEEVITRVSMSIKILGCVSIASLNYFWDDSEIASHILPLISRRRLKYSMGSRFLISKSTYVGNTSKKDPRILSLAPLTATTSFALILFGLLLLFPLFHFSRSSVDLWLLKRLLIDEVNVKRSNTNIIILICHAVSSFLFSTFQILLKFWDPA